VAAFQWRHSSNNLAALSATERRLGVQPSARARTPEDLIAGERVGVRAHLLTRLRERDVANPWRDRNLRRDRPDEIDDALVPFVIRVEHA
jgi:hypothetical protein